jgi:iron complex outermembrane receptor protein
MNNLFTVFALSFCNASTAQQIDTIKSPPLQEVTVRAFEQTRQLRDATGAVSFIGHQRLEQFSPAGTIHAINTLPGVRMEERSPGSYRLNVRGSALRSPFGVRNVKVYYNDLPFTDPGGQSYFNMLSYYNFNSIEIIKGPGSSVYGAGTGGVFLIESMGVNERPAVLAEVTAGSFGLKNIFASVTTGQESKSKLSFQSMQSDGYRSNSALDRKIFNWNGRFTPSVNSVLKTTILYSRLFYQTPGALTLAEFTADPKAFRPAGGGFPSAAQSKASILQTTFLAGLSYKQNISPGFSNSSSAYGMFTQLDNPAIRNYGQNRDPHAGGRTTFQYQIPLADGTVGVTAGAEIQQGFSSVSVFKNRNGAADTLQSTDETPIRQSLLFLQGSFEQSGWELTLGASLNFLNVSVRRSFPTPLPQQQRRFSNEVTPRIAVAKKWKALTAYASIAEGFSPPTAAELFPSGSSTNLLLNPERGTNYDLGFRGTVGRLSVDVNAFYFRLQNTLAQRRDAGGGDYYINAGKTVQKGLETLVSLQVLRSFSFVRQSSFWLSHTWHQFHYKDFMQLSTDYSGKRLPGIAPHTLSVGWSLTAKKGFLANINYYFSDKLPLNDANTAFANSYHLLFAKMGMEKEVMKRWRLKMTAGAENLLNQTYSLGNDINAFGGRYYNAAPGRSFYLSLMVSFLAGRTE